MNDSARTDPPTIPTIDLRAHDALDAGLAAAFAPDSGPPLPVRVKVGKAIAESMRDLTRVQLRDPVDEHEPELMQSQYSEIPKDNEPGSRYELHGEIARGGMGAVLKGHDTELGRAVAVKVLLENHRGKPHLLQRFIEEAQIAGQLQHPGIVPVYEMGYLPDKRPYFSMKLVKGQTLARLLILRKDTRTDRPRYLKIFEQICQTLAYAHARGVIHRDLKPSNVMVGPFGEVQVMDWGLAKVLDRNETAGDTTVGGCTDQVSVIRTRRREGADVTPYDNVQTQHGCVMGTMSYMPPEQALGEIDRLDPRSDVFGLGAVLCEILTNRPPYVATEATHLWRQATRADLTDAFGRLDACYADPDLVQLTKRCLDPDPNKRPADAGVLTREFTAYLESVDARLRAAELASAEARAKTLEERKRRKVQLALALAIFCLLTGAAIAGLWVQKDLSAKSAQDERSRSEAKALITEVEALLHDAAEHMKAERWAEARALLERAGGRMAGGGPEPLQKRVAQARKDVELIAELEEIRLRQSAIKDGTFDLESADPLYAAAFKKYGLDLEQMDNKEAVALVRGSLIREGLLAALYNWRLSQPKQRKRQEQLLEQADDDPWRGDFRKYTDNKDIERLKNLASRPETLKQPPAVLALLGVELAKTMPDEAIRVFRHAQRLHPGDFWLNLQLGTALITKETAEEAVRYLTAAVALRPASAGTRLALGNALREKGDIDGAMAAFEGAVACDPTYPMAFNNLGVTRHDKRDFDGAIGCFQKALALDPKHFRSHNNLASSLREKGELNDALLACLKAVELAPAYPAARVNLGLILKAKGDLAGAIEAYDKALELNPKIPDIHYNLGNAWLAKRNPDKAISYFQKTIELDPKDARPHNNLGVALREKNEVSSAIASYRTAIALDPSYTIAYNNLGNSLMDKRDLDGAVEAFRKALEIDAKYAEAHRNLGIALSEKRDFAGASLSFRAAVNLEPKHIPTLYNLGNALRDKGDLENAASVFRQVIELEPTFAQAICNLARVVQKQGRFAEAYSLMKQGHEVGTQRRDWRYPSEQWVAQLKHLMECEEKLPAFQKGEFVPKDNRGRLGLSEVCAGKKLYYTAYQLLAAAFAAEPKLATDLRAPYRYNAACYAVLAANRQGADANSMDETEKSRLRTQALDWLRAELILRDAQAASDKPAERAFGLARLRNCVTDKDLDSVRGGRALAESERVAWEEFWDDLETAVARRTAK